MQVLVLSVWFLLLAGVLAVPVLTALLIQRFWVGLVVAVLAAVCLITALSWWDVFSVDLRLAALGYDPMGMTLEERVRDVPEDQKEHAEGLYAMTIAGVGWPVAAISLSIAGAPFAAGLFVATRLARRIGKA